MQTERRLLLRIVAAGGVLLFATWAALAQPASDDLLDLDAADAEAVLNLGGGVCWLADRQVAVPCEPERYTMADITPRAGCTPGVGFVPPRVARWSKPFSSAGRSFPLETQVKLPNLGAPAWRKAFVDRYMGGDIALFGTLVPQAGYLSATGFVPRLVLERAYAAGDADLLRGNYCGAPTVQEQWDLNTGRAHCDRLFMVYHHATGPGLSPDKPARTSSAPTGERYRYSALPGDCGVVRYIHFTGDATECFGPGYPPSALPPDACAGIVDPTPPPPVDPPPPAPGDGSWLRPDPSQLLGRAARACPELGWFPSGVCAAAVSFVGTLPAEVVASGFEKARKLWREMGDRPACVVSRDGVRRDASFRGASGRVQALPGEVIDYVAEGPCSALEVRP